MLVHPAIDPGLGDLLRPHRGQPDRPHLAVQRLGPGRRDPVAADGDIRRRGVFAAALAFVPRRRTLPQVAALAAAVMIALQLSVDHWFYLYIPWFFGALAIALLASGRATAGRAAPSTDEEGMETRFGLTRSQDHVSAVRCVDAAMTVATASAKPKAKPQAGVRSSGSTPRGEGRPDQPSRSAAGSPTAANRSASPRARRPAAGASSTARERAAASASGSRVRAASGRRAYRDRPTRRRFRRPRRPPRPRSVCTKRRGNGAAAGCAARRR